MDDVPPEGRRGDEDGASDDHGTEPDAAVDELVRDLARWAAQGREREAAITRSRQRWLERQAEEEATLATLLVDLAEGALPVVVRTVSGRTHRGTVEAVGRDFLALRDGPARRVTMVTFEAVSSVRPAPDSRGPSAVAAGERGHPLEATLADVLLGLAGERLAVALSVWGEAAPIVGELRATGADVITIRLAADAPSVVYVPLWSVTEISIP